MVANGVGSRCLVVATVLNVSYVGSSLPLSLSSSVSSWSTSLLLLLDILSSSTPILVAAAHAHTRERKGKGRENRFSSLSAGHAAGLPSPSFPSKGFS